MKNKLIPFFIIFELCAKENIVNLEKEKENLIFNYVERIESAKNENLEDRVIFLDKTLSCIIKSKTKKDITNCKNDERKRIMNLING